MFEDTAGEICDPFMLVIQLESVCQVSVDSFRRLLIHNGLLKITVK